MPFFSGTPERFEQRSTLGPEQMAQYSQLRNAGMSRGAGGAFGDAADYYRGLMSNNSSDLDAFAAPEMRRFREQTIPGISEQFAGMGSGGLSSSGFQNASVNAGTDLAERIGAIRANLRMQGAQGLANIGSQGLGQFNQNTYRPGQEGFLPSLAPAIGMAAGAYFGGPAGALAGGGIADAVKGWFGSSNAYGGKLENGPAGLYPTQGNYNPYTDQMGMR